MLCSNLVELLQSIVIATLVLVAYAPNVLTRSDEIATNAVNPSNRNASMSKKVPYEEYFIEHNISHGDARRSFFQTGVKLINGAYSIRFENTINANQLDGDILIVAHVLFCVFIADKPMGFCTNFKCTDQIISYCLSGKMVADHCCCDSRHGTGNL